MTHRRCPCPFAPASHVLAPAPRNEASPPQTRTHAYSPTARTHASPPASDAPWPRPRPIPPRRTREGVPQREEMPPQQHAARIFGG